MDEQLEIRRLGSDDASAVLAASHLFDEPVQPDLAGDFLRRPGHHLLIAYLDDVPTGFVSGVEIAHPDKRVEVLVYELGVDEAYRRRGIARELLRALDTLARELGARGAWVVTEPDNDAALATYRSVGASADTTVTLTWSLSE